MRRVTSEERRVRVARRHLLAAEARAVDPLEAGAVVGLHATDPASVYLAARARLADPSVAEIERALYEERTVVRMIGMRRTMFVVPLDLAAIVRAACTERDRGGTAPAVLEADGGSGIAARRRCVAGRSRAATRSPRSRPAGRRSPSSCPETCRACARS